MNQQKDIRLLPLVGRHKRRQKISCRTVDTFRMKLIEKTGCTNLATLIHYAYKEGMLNGGF